MRGLVFTLVMVVEARWFLIVSVPLALIVAVILGWTARVSD